MDVSEHKNHAHADAPIHAVREQMDPFLRGETEQASIKYPQAKNKKYLKC